MTPGAMLLRFRQKFGHGLRVAYYRDVVRPRILSTPPVEISTELQAVETFALTGQQDLLNLLWSLKSFYHFAGRDWPLTILDDGTLSSSNRETLSAHFPHARIISASESDKAISQRLANYPRCRRYRDLHPLARKCFDVGAFLRSDRVLLLDSDLIFFREPTALLARADAADGTNCFNTDVASALNISVQEARDKFGIALNERINSGIGLLFNQVFNLDWMEEFLGCESIWAGRTWRIEQTLLALAASRDGVQLLPQQEYLVSLQEGTQGCAAKHYVGAVRHLMYREGIAQLVRNGFLEHVSTNAHACVG